MRQFDVFINPSRDTRDFAPFVVALQSHPVSLDSIIVAPIIEDSDDYLFNIAVEVEGRLLHIAMAELANIPAQGIGRARANLAEHEDAIRRALDRLFTGF
uniref:CcdB family protein n=1 Tax=uncultured Caulobacter sp. TaxID=158749 RepID=UPI0025F0AC7A|nr:CcdB family protein [uncultured Caulobacter sp.]